MYGVGTLNKHSAGPLLGPVPAGCDEVTLRRSEAAADPMSSRRKTDSLRGLGLHFCNNPRPRKSATKQ